ncbi:MAG: hypothetical protein RR051_00345 [Clostridiales bacterium]
MDFAALKNSFAQLTADAGVDDASLVVWFNEAQLDIALEAGNVVKQIFADAAAGIGYDKPPRCIRVEDCSVNYTISPEGKLVFAVGGDIDVYYRQAPREFALSDSGMKCELDQLLHSLIPLFAASRYWDQESEGDYEESGHGNKWMNYYLQGKAQRIKTLGGWGNQLDRWTVED